MKTENENQMIVAADSESGVNWTITRDRENTQEFWIWTAGEFAGIVEGNAATAQDLAREWARDRAITSMQASIGATILDRAN